MPRMKLCSCGKKIPDTAVCECRKNRNKLKNQQNVEATTFYKSYKWRKFRERIIKRDQEICIRCMITHNYIEKNNLEVHHIKPRSQYPELAFDETNVITLCKSCNTHLGTKGELDFKWNIAEDWEPVL